MELYQYKYFLAVAATNNFQIAAEKLYLTRQAISQSITQMEKQLGYPLFLRTKSGLVLTAEGELFLPRVEKLVKMQEKMEHDMRQCSTKSRQEIRLYYTYTTYHLYEDRFMKFQKDHDDELLLEINGCREADCVRLLQEARADIIISTFIPKFGGCQSRLLMQYPLSLMMSTKNKLATKEKVELADLEGETFLAYKSGDDSGVNVYLPDYMLYGANDARCVYSDDLIYLFHRVRNNRGILMGVEENLVGLLNGVVFKLFPEAGNWNHYFTVSNSFQDDLSSLHYSAKLFDSLIANRKTAQ